MILKNHLLFYLIFILFVYCSEFSQPKPKGHLSLEYPTPTYIQKNNEKFIFEHNSFAEIQNTPLGINIFYSKMKATLYMSHSEINNNLDSLLNDAYKLPSKHLIKAQRIPERIFVNNKNKIYGTLFNVVGDAASQIQFFLTDSTDNFLIGALYFYSKPNYDSIFPAVKYVENDIIRMIENLRWNN
ncbi:MAG: gliding motility lipoprotein GldD [Flavobacteriaceae bacterium]|nr:gliding motility lipoprotein GldD [Flavobacteriaceae bacterium]|tara:strand:- start:15657 stop:16211 length:555 start_codon:yes stop_codon:yes gene_type:complete